MAASEPFPLLKTSVDQLHSATLDSGSSARRRRKSSGLGGEIRAGDTGAPALATSFAHMSATPDHHHGGGGGGGSSSGLKRTSKRRKARSLLRRAKHFAIRHTWFLPLVILAVFLSLYGVNPTPANPIHRFIFLSYRLPASEQPADLPPQYGKGLWDIAFVSFYTVVLSFTRELIMQEMLRPLARWCGLSKAKQARFMEQMYTAVYFGFLGPAGLWVMSRSPVWYFNVEGMYADFPHRTHAAEFKFYYLFQAAYWAQQAIVLVLGMEKPRKDFKELIAHHIVSLALIALSYRFHFTYMGLAVYVSHDISDFFLATSKSLNYVDSPIMAPYFASFVLIWIYLRHYLNLRIIFSLFNEFVTVGPYELNWETQQYKCWLSQLITGTLLCSLQALNLFWLFYILRIAYRYAFLDIVKDDRSDDEEEEEEEEEEKKKMMKDRAEGPASLPSAGTNGTAGAQKAKAPEVMLNGSALPNGSAASTGRVTRSSVKQTSAKTRPAAS